MTSGYEKDGFAFLIDGFELSETRKRLLATASRREGVYNRTGEPSETFCGKEEQRNERETTFDAVQKSRRKRYAACDDVCKCA